MSQLKKLNALRIYKTSVIHQAAKQIGLTVPPNVLARADRVIR